MSNYQKTKLTTASIKEDLSISRSIFLMLFIFILFGALIGRAFYIQVINKEFLQEKGEEKFTKSLPIPAFRGKIFDRDGNILAITNATKDIAINPKEFNNEDPNVEQMFKILGLNKKIISQKIKNAKSFTYLKRQVDLETFEKIKQLKIAGVVYEDSQKRFYPASENASHLTGFLSIDGEGIEGVELFKNKELKEIFGQRTIIRTRKGEIIGEIGERVLPENGKDIHLTVSAKLQAISKKYLMDAIDKHDAKAGSIVMLDAKNGDVLALVNYPDYNPNSRKNINQNTMRNRAIVDIFEPGSIIKPFPILLAMDKKLINEHTLFDTREFTIGKKKIHDVKKNDSLDVTGIIQKSSNIGTVKIGMQLGEEEMFNMFHNVGFGEKLNIGFPGESKGIIRNYANWKPIEQANMSFGHGLSVNLLQMAHAYQVFTNKGAVCDITIYKENNRERLCKKVFSEENAEKMKFMLQKVSEKGGTAQLAQTKDYHVGGKTGTANKIENGRYVTKYISSFVGFAPVEDPKIIIAIMVDEPRKNGYYGGVVAGPVFSNVAQESLAFMSVPKEKFSEEEIAAEEKYKNSEELDLIEKLTEEKKNEPNSVIEKSIQNVESSMPIQKVDKNTNNEEKVVLKTSEKILEDSSENKKINIQVVAIESKDKAEKIVEELKSNGFNAYKSIVFNAKNIEVYRVRVVASDENKSEVMTNLILNGYKPFIVK